ncbi:MAG: nitroreductase family protein, partial [Prevotella sp.]|nr:nitroreductase family protein [Prevotella sp.]
MTSKLIIIVLLLALLIVCGKLYMGTSGRKAPANDVTDALATILTRSSVRAYTAQPVEQAKVQKLLRAGMAAPSACDKRPWHFVVVTDKQQLKGLAEANPNASYADSAPLAIVVCGD